MPKVKDLSPKLSGLIPAEQEFILPQGVTDMGNRVGGISAYSNTFKRGYGDKVFGSDENGIWLGAADWENAPFRVDMQGRMYFSATDGSDNQLVIDAVNLRMVLYIAGVPQALWGYQAGGF